MSAAEFYDNFISYQIESGINDRIYSLFKRLRRLGIADSDILEIGCGIGTLTFLLAGKIGSGSIEAIDISSKSIEFAQKHIKKSNVFFSACDILDYIPRSPFFDKILLFDVLEHIPEKEHFNIFSKIRGWMKDDSLLLINLPNPQYIIYDQKNNPEALQELDQPIFLDKLITTLAKLSMDMVYLETYSVWAKDDYQFLIVKKRTDFVERLLSSERLLFEKLTVRLGRLTRKLKYPYPKSSDI
jgi:2-polyprenyl-3-methyl-5-hydroxy-6-metoxy-1,4-benzoquinol methylase